jgi:acyl-coenzyme A thioesterase PaaI-like protein
VSERHPLRKPGGLTTCYGCGKDNPRGLRLEFFREGDTVAAAFTPAPDHGGYGQVVHGGVVATALDEALGWAIYGLLDKLGVTTDLRVRFEAPVLCGRSYTVRGRVERKDDRGAEIAAEIVDADEKRVASGLGTMRFVTARAIERIGGFKW